MLKWLALAISVSDNVPRTSRFTLSQVLGVAAASDYGNAKKGAGTRYQAIAVRIPDLKQAIDFRGL